MVTLTRGVVEYSLNANVADGTAGTTFALPRTCDSDGGFTIAWQCIYGGTVSAVSTALQISMDNSNWTTVDTNTSTSGSYRIVTPIIARFIRAYHTSDTGATTIAVSILLQ